MLLVDRLRVGVYYFLSIISLLIVLAGLRLLIARESSV